MAAVPSAPHPGGGQPGAYRPEIDGLRMIAVLSVIFYHAGLPGFSGGYIGVDVFFVISGYLITGIIGREIDEGRFSFVRFYERRVRRILPALFAVCLFCLAASWFVLSPKQLRDFGQSLAATMSFLANIYFYLKSGYFTPDIHTIPLIHMWSLAVEEQFYVLFPILLIVMARFRRTTQLLLLAGALTLSLALSIRHQQSWPLGNFYLLPFRAWELLAGSLLARHRGLIPAIGTYGLAAPFLQLLGLVLICAPVALYNDRTVFPGLAAIPPVLGTAILIAAMEFSGPARRLLASGPAVAIGLISYSAYLWHQPLFAFAQLWQGNPPVMSVKLGLIGLTLGIAWISWRYIEGPWRDRHRHSRGIVFAWAGALSLGFLAIGLALHVLQGVPQRFPAAQRALAATMEPSRYRTICHTEGEAYRKPADACRYPQGGKLTWAVLGDSHAIELGDALADQLRPRGEALAHLTFSGCAPAVEFRMDNPGCNRWTREALDWIAARPEITHVFVAYRHNFYLFGNQTPNWPRQADEHPPFLREEPADKAREAYWRSFEALVHRLRQSGKHVVIASPIPELPAHVDRFIFSSGMRDMASGYPASWYTGRNADSLKRVREIAARQGASVLDSGSSLCDAKRCLWQDAGSALYFDDNHLSMAGARRVIGHAVAKGELKLD